MMLYETDCYYCKNNKTCLKAYNAMLCTNNKKITQLPNLPIIKRRNDYVSIRGNI